MKNIIPNGSKLRLSSHPLRPFIIQTFRLGIFALVLAFWSPRPCGAAGIVTVLDEAHLRAALVGGGTVTFAGDGTILLTNTLTLTNATVIDATGHNVTLSGGDAVRLIRINPGITASLVHLTLANGFNRGSDGTSDPPVTDGQPGMGAAVFNEGGTVILSDCMVTSNAVAGGNGFVGLTTGSFSGSPGGQGRGGAICNLAGNIFATNCIFDGNSSTGGTGGEYNIGSYEGGNAEGGAVFSSGGNVIVHNSTFKSNRTQGGAPGGFEVLYLSLGGSGCGGALWSSNTVVQLVASTFSGNASIGADLPFSGGAGGVGSGKGGALFTAGGSLSCAGCSFSTNRVLAGSRVRYGLSGVSQGGAVWGRSPISVRDSIFTANQALGNTRAGMPGMTAGEGSGGAVFTEGSLTVSTSSFVENESRGGDGGVWLHSYFAGGNGTGGGIYNTGWLSVTNCTFEGNSATGGSAILYPGGTAYGGTGVGGALYNTNGTTWLVNLTFAMNSATGGHGAIPGLEGPSLGGAILNTNATVNLSGTIIANSTSGSNCFGTVIDQGHNLSSDGSAGFAGAGSMNNTDPKLGPLDDYGGPTPTMVLLSGSPAIDGGGNGSVPANDQRGHARPFGAALDIGAFESSPPYLIRGRVSGATLQDEVVIDASATQTNTTNHGQYTLQGLTSGTFAVTPESTNYLFVPANRSITVGPDQINVNFQAYHWNALSLDDTTNQTMHVVMAVTNGQTMRLQASTNLVQWSSISTNTSGPSNYLEFFLPIGTLPKYFYRAAIP